MSREDLLQLEGKVSEVLANGNFRVELDNGQNILAQLAGKLRRFHIRVILGDRVLVGVSPYDLTHGLIMHRFRDDDGFNPGPPGGTGGGGKKGGGGKRPQKS